MMGKAIGLLEEKTFEGFVYQGFIAFLAGVAGVAGSFAVAGNTRAFVGTQMFDVLVNYTPAAVVNFMLESLGTFGKATAVLGALALCLAVIGTFSFVGVAFGRYAGIDYVSSGLAFGLTSLFALVFTGAVAPSFASGATAGAVVGLFDYRYKKDEGGDKKPQKKPDQDRRRALQASAGTVGIAGASYLMGDYLTPEQDIESLGTGEGVPPEVESMINEAQEKSLELTNTPGLISEYGEFYTIDINSVPPQVQKEDWSLNITGMVETESTLTYDELTSMEPEHRYITLRCVGDDLNGRQMDNAVWTGVPLGDLIEDSDPQGDHVVMHGHDDFDNTVPLDVLREGFLAYGMNGDELPREHGHPVRILLPGHWGEVNVKWVREIEVLDQNPDGYWERRGWEGTGRVNRVAKVWSRETDEEEGTIRIGGHAYAGIDGVETVEVSVDGGTTWDEAVLSEPLGEKQDDAWRQWLYEWEAEEDTEYEAVVRMIDKNGEVQEQQRSGSSPDGATGWVSETVSLHSVMG